MIDRLELSITRKLQLLRGTLARWRGARVGIHFGLGKSTRLLYPSRFSAGDHVTISDFSHVDCRSRRGVKFGHHTSIERNLWLVCGAETVEDGFFEIGNHSYIGCNAVIGAGGGGIKIGDHVLIGHTVNMHSENHVFNDPSQLIQDQGITFKGIVIEDNVWIGSQVTILDGVTIGRGSVIGAGAVVTQSVPANSIAVGIPARVIGTRDNKPVDQ